MPEQKNFFLSLIVAYVEQRVWFTVHPQCQGLCWPVGWKGTREQGTDSVVHVQGKHDLIPNKDGPGRK